MARTFVISSDEPVIAARVSTRSLMAVHKDSERAQAERAIERGTIEALAGFAGAASALNEAAAHMHEERSRLEGEAVQLALELAFTITRQLVHTEVRANRHNVEAIVREVLAEAGAGRGTYTVHVCPSDLGQLSESAFRAGTSVVADPELTPGDVHIETPRGVCVREVDEALEELGRRLREELTGGILTSTEASG